MIPTHTYIYIVFILKGMCLQIVFLYIQRITLSSNSIYPYTLVFWFMFFSTYLSISHTHTLYVYSL